MCPRTSKQFEDLREGKRRHILDAAIECFATKGYHAVSISELAKHAGISKGLMYNYFTSKDELLKTIFSEIMATILQIFNPSNLKEIDRKTLLEYFDRVFAHMESNLILWKMYMAIFSQPAVLQILATEIELASRQPFAMIERYFKKQGVKNPAVEVVFLSTIISGVTFEYLADPGNYPLKQIKKRIISLY